MGAVDSEIVVVGAGPTGLTLACRLLHLGVPCTVIDKEPEPTRWSRAIGMSPRSLEVFDQFGAAEELVERGLPCTVANFYSRGRRVGRLRLSRLRATRYRFMLALMQSATEEVLQRHLLRLGGSIERGVRLTGLRQTPAGDRVTLELQGPSVTRSLTARWVVGADGAHSAVRRLAGIAFTGVGASGSFVNVDAELGAGPAAGEGHYYFSRAGIAVVIPLADGHYRVTASLRDAPGDAVGDAPGATTGGDLGLEAFETIVAERAGARLRVGRLRDSGWGISRFEVHKRIASRFRAGRCLLVGDAAHLYGPVGGQGMNGGIQDAQNLAWKLALVAGGDAGERLLDTYEQERRRTAGRVLHAVERLTRMALLRDPLTTTVRDTVMRVGTATGALDRRIAPEIGQFDVAYGRGAGAWRRGRGARALGRRIPDTPLSREGEPTTLFALLRERPFTLLGLALTPAHDSAWSALGARVRALHGDTVALFRVCDHPSAQATALADGDGELHRYLAARRPTLCVLRGDGHVAHVCSFHQASTLLGCLSENYALRPRVRSL
ncbi:MAG TPA: FAD-dependent monooxygenase [Solirubrobacteraceae bacterium]|nr:FAD-dependent monooxygenase [Solirubrobacteraceae bacterium]